MRDSLRFVAVPLFVYLLIAVVLPLLNGAAARPGFADHCWNIVAVCGALTVGVVAIHAAIARVTRAPNSWRKS